MYSNRCSFRSVFDQSGRYAVLLGPRRGKESDAAAARLRKDFGGPVRLGMRAGYGHRNLNENLAPLRRYLRAQLGRPWKRPA